MSDNTFSDKEKAGVACCCGCCATIVIIIIILSSLARISHNEYALQYNTYTRELKDEEPLTEGRTWVGMYTELFKYPAKAVVKDFENQWCYTNDGIVVRNNIEVTYTLKGTKDSLEYIFWNFGTFKNYEKHINTAIVTQLRNVCTEFIAIDFPNIRGSIEQAMETKLKSYFEIDGSIVLVTRAQLKNYSFPKSLDDAITNKQKSLQGINNAENKRQGEITKAETRLGTAQIQAESINVQADIKYNTIIDSAKAKATSVEKVWENRATVYKLNQDSFGFTPEQLVESYLKGTVLRNANSPVISV